MGVKTHSWLKIRDLVSIQEISFHLEFLSLVSKQKFWSLILIQIAIANMYWNHVFLRQLEKVGSIRQEWESNGTYGKSFKNMENSKTFIHVHRDNLVMAFSYKEDQAPKSKIKFG